MRAPVRLLTTPTPAMFSLAISTSASSAAVSGVTAITCAHTRARGRRLPARRTRLPCPEAALTPLLCARQHHQHHDTSLPCSTSWPCSVHVLVVCVLVPVTFLKPATLCTTRGHDGAEDRCHNKQRNGIETPGRS